MNKHFIPSTFKRKEQRVIQQPKDVQLEKERIDIDWLNRFLGKINFYSFSFVKVRPDTYATNFRVYTKHYIHKSNIYNMIEEAFPEGCEVKPVIGYKWRRTFDVKTSRPIRWDTFIWRIVNALEERL